MKELFETFCSNSSLHCLGHLVNKRKTLSERVFWAVVFTTATCLLVTQVHIELLTLFSSKVLAVVENPHYDLGANEFPAVTVCSNINVMKSKVNLLMESYNISKTNHSRFINSLIALSFMRLAHYNLPQEYVNSINGNVYPIRKEDIMDIMVKVKPDLDLVMDNCTWKFKQYECKKLFRVQFTYEGFCYSFNSKTAQRLREDPADLPPLELPNKSLVGFRTSMFGSDSGLGFHLKSLAHETVSDTLFGDYYSIIIDKPSLIPDSFQMFTIPPKNPLYNNRISLSVSVIEADKSLHDLEETLRDCIFYNESKIQNCWLECRYESIMSYCHCLPYSIHFLHPETDVCGLANLQCLDDLYYVFRTLGVPKGDPGFPNWIQSWESQCHCLQTCSYIAYTPRLELTEKEVNSNGYGWTPVVVYYKGFAVKYSRTASYKFRDLVVNCGSFASLLLGFSIVAVLDFFVYIIKFFYLSLVKVFKRKSYPKAVIKNLKRGKR